MIWKVPKKYYGFTGISLLLSGFLHFLFKYTHREKLLGNYGENMMVVPVDQAFIMLMNGNLAPLLFVSGALVLFLYWKLNKTNLLINFSILLNLIVGVAFIGGTLYSFIPCIFWICILIFAVIHGLTIVVVPTSLILLIIGLFMKKNVHLKG